MELSPKINCFIGNNGEGKTNLLDSVYFLSFCKSHNNAFDSLNIRHDQEYAMLTGTYQKSEDNLMEITVGMKRKGRKVLKKNKKEYDRQADHIGEIPLVLVSPADQVLIIGGSEERRKFMDGVIAQYDHPYLNHLLAYGRALKQRNSLLKQECTDDSLFDVLEQQMDISSQYLFDRRKDFVERFTPIFQQFYSFISEDKEQVSFGYTSHLQGSTPLADLLRSHRATDRLIGYTTKGCHRDDLEMRLGDYPLRGTASQGQAKTYLIALKLAQFDFLSHLNGTLPILLFDDIFDKLDAERVQRIVTLINKEPFGQIFITDTDRQHLTQILGDVEGHIFHVEKGTIV